MNKTIPQLRRGEISQLFKGRNMMTPEIIRYGQSGRYAYELSTGTGFLTQTPLYGVTLVDLVHGHTKPEDPAQSRSFDDLEEAEAFIKMLGE